MSYTWGNPSHAARPLRRLHYQQPTTIAALAFDALRYHRDLRFWLEVRTARLVGFRCSRSYNPVTLYLATVLPLSPAGLPRRATVTTEMLAIDGEDLGRPPIWVAVYLRVLDLPGGAGFVISRDHALLTLAQVCW